MGLLLKDRGGCNLFHLQDLRVKENAYARRCKIHFQTKHFLLDMTFFAQANIIKKF